MKHTVIISDGTMAKLTEYCKKNQISAHHSVDRALSFAIDADFNRPVEVKKAPRKEPQLNPECQDRKDQYPSKKQSEKE